MPLLSATIFVCESVLKESNGVYTAIRISDLVEYTVIPDLPLERQAVQTTFFGVLRLGPEDNEIYTARIRAIRPSGVESLLGEPVTIQPANVTAVRPGTTKTQYIVGDVRVVPPAGHSLRCSAGGRPRGGSICVHANTC